MKQQIPTLLFGGLLCLLSIGCNGGSPRYKITDNGVIVNLPQPNEARSVRLQAIDDHIIRLTATRRDTFSTAPSLAVTKQAGGVKFDVVATDSCITLKTAGASATLSLPQGDVKFYDADGKLVLAEEPGGRSITPIEIEGKRYYSCRQSFSNLNEQEGLYGLGQHQADEFNYKGKNEELFQYNTKVSVPFVVSTDHYGLLWDSYSLCRFGNAQDYSRLGELFTLYDKQGEQGALTGTYTDGRGNETVRREPDIYFEHLIRGDLGHVVNLPQDLRGMPSHITYEGAIEAPESGLYPFILYYSGYQTVYIDGQEVVPQRWRTAWNPNSYKFSVKLEKGKRTHIKIDWQPNGGTAYCGLRAYPAKSEQERGSMSWWGEVQDEIDYYFVQGESMDEVIAGYRTLTGKAPIMPRWVTGYWQSREKYNTQSEVLSTLAEFRRRHVPIDNIVIDWLHWKEDQWGSHEFDPQRFPTPAAMVDSIHAMNGRVMISVWPKFYVNTEHYKEFDQKGWMYQQAIKDSIRDWVGRGYLGSFYDAYAPGARKLFWQQIEEHYYPLGIDAWWMDASEPNIRDCTDIEYRKALCGPTHLGPAAKYFNAYALVNAQAIYDGQRGTEPNRRVFLLTRSGFAGQQRYSTATWSGDIATRWEDMKAQISAGLNFSVSGIPWWSMDIGGFCVEDRYTAAAREYEQSGKENDDLKEWRELNVRWHQFGAFTPMYRSHGQWPYREPFNVAPEEHPAYRAILYYNRLRYRLQPYIYTLAADVHFNDYTIMRPLVMDFTDDLSVRNVQDQFMFGPALMAAPVTEYGARSRSVVFPAAAGWYDLYSGQPMPAATTAQVEAPYERMPLYAKAGAILPVGPQIEWTDQPTDGSLTLYVYAGADGKFTLYEDEGVNYNYEKGIYSTIGIRYDDAAGSLTLEKRKGQFPGMAENRKIKIVKVSPQNRQGIDAKAPGVTVTYNGEEQTIKI